MQMGHGPSAIAYAERQIARAEFIERARRLVLSLNRGEQAKDFSIESTERADGLR